MRGTGEAGTSRRGRRLFGLGALGLGLLAALALLELGARLARLDAEELRITFDPGTPEWARFDSLRGWANLEGAPESNRQGFRFPRDYEREARRGRRLVLLGDSQVWGMGVKADEHLGVLLDAELPGAEAYAFGVPGYGPVQELLLLREVLADYEVDEVLAVAFVYNDLVDESVRVAYGGFQKPYLAEGSGAWVLRAGPLPRPVLRGPGDSLPFFGRAPEMEFLAPLPWLERRSALYRAVLQRASSRPALARLVAWLGLARLVGERATAHEFYSIVRIDGRPVPCWHLERCPEEHWLDGLEAVVAAYREMRELCRQQDAAFGVILTPSYAELARGRFEVIDALADRLAEEGIAVVDAREAFLSEVDWRNVVGPDRHWTALGHRLVAEAVLQRAEALPGRPRDPAPGETSP